MESQEKNSYLFYLIIALIVLGFIASLAFPVNAQEHKLRGASHFAEDFVPANDNPPPRATRRPQPEPPNRRLEVDHKKTPSTRPGV
jgi:hypothetical protein